MYQLLIEKQVQKQLAYSGTRLHARKIGYQ